MLCDSVHVNDRMGVARLQGLYSGSLDGFEGPLGVFPARVDCPQTVRSSWRSEHVQFWAEVVMGLGVEDVHLLSALDGPTLVSRSLPPGLSAGASTKLHDAREHNNWGRQRRQCPRRQVALHT